MTWEQRLAKKYYDQLFKEYALCELSRYKQGHIALRWRTEDEVVFGKGQFICASMQCVVTDNLTSWEVNFGYVEEGIKKNELVKVRLCPDCSDKLNYKTQKRRTKKTEKEIADTVARPGKRKKTTTIDHESSEENDNSHRTKRQSGSSEHSNHLGNEQPSEKQDGKLLLIVHTR
jgi:protein FRA10AC1